MHFRQTCWKACSSVLEDQQLKLIFYSTFTGSGFEPNPEQELALYNVLVNQWLKGKVDNPVAFLAGHGIHEPEQFGL